jgi:hypothetical protein
MSQLKQVSRIKEKIKNNVKVFCDEFNVYHVYNAQITKCEMKYGTEIFSQNKKRISY